MRADQVRDGRAERFNTVSHDGVWPREAHAHNPKPALAQPPFTRSAGTGADPGPCQLPRVRPPLAKSLLASMPCRGLLDLRLHGFEVEARALLHRRKLERRLGQFADLLLGELEPPELVDEPVVVRDRTIGLPLDMPVRSYGSRRRLTMIGQSTLTVAPSQPLGLIGKAIFEVVDAHRATACFR